MYINQDDVKDILNSLVNQNKLKVFEKFYKEFYDQENFIKNNLSQIIKEKYLSVMMTDLLQNEVMLKSIVPVDEECQKNTEFFWTQYINKERESNKAYLEFFKKDLPMIFHVIPYMKDDELVTLFKDAYIMSDLSYEAPFKDHITLIYGHLFVQQIKSQNTLCLEQLESYRYRNYIDLYDCYQTFNFQPKDCSLINALVIMDGREEILPFLMKSNYEQSSLLKTLLQVSAAKYHVSIKSSINHTGMQDRIESFKDIKPEIINKWIDYLLDKYFDNLEENEKEELIVESLSGEKSKTNAMLKKMNQTFESYQPKYHSLINKLDYYANKNLAKRLYQNNHLFDIFVGEHHSIEHFLNPFYQYHSTYGIEEKDIIEKITHELMSKKPSQIKNIKRWNELKLPQEVKEAFQFNKVSQMMTVGNSYMFEGLLNKIIENLDLGIIDKNFQGKLYKNLSNNILDQYTILEQLLLKTILKPFDQISFYDLKYEHFESCAAELLQRNHRTLTVLDTFFDLRKKIKNENFSQNELSYILKAEEEIDVFLKNIVLKGYFLNTKKIIFEESKKWIEKNSINLKELVPVWHKIKESHYGREPSATQFLIEMDQKMIMSEINTSELNNHSKSRKL